MSVVTERADYGLPHDLPGNGPITLSTDEAVQWVENEYGLPCNPKLIQGAAKAGTLRNYLWQGRLRFGIEDLREWVESHRRGAP